MKNKKTRHIHFVCTGNVYRSRLAETYLKSLKIPDLTVSSSGLEADIHRSENGPISWFALRLLAREGLVAFISQSSTQTDKTKLTQVDLVVFMHRDNLAMFEKNFSGLKINHRVWDIPDLHHLGFSDKPKNKDQEKKILKATEDTFLQIKRQVDRLVKNLGRY